MTRKMTTTIVFVILILLITSFSLFKLKESSKWTPTKGTILQSEREMVRSSSSAGSDYNLLVQYGYQVNGKEYTGNRLMAGIPNLMSSQIVGGLLMKMYIVGDEVNVFYNPDSPNDAVLVTGKDIPTIAYILFFAFQIIAALLAIFVSGPSSFL